MDLKQKAIAEILKDAGNRIAAVEKHAGLIAECAATAAQLNNAAGARIFSPLICAHATGSLSAWIRAEGQRSEVYAAISRAGIVCGHETPCNFDERHTTIYLKGLDVTIVAAFEVELAEAA